MEKAELLFIPGPGMGHLMAAVEFGKLLTNRDERLSIVFFIINLPYNTGIDTHNISNFTDAPSRIRFLNIPPINSNQVSTSKNRNVIAIEMIDGYKPGVRDAIIDIISKSKSNRVAGIVVDMFCVNMIDVANELGLPSYVFFTSSASFLGLLLHVQTLKDQHNQDITEYKDTDAELLIPNFMNPVPAKVLPTTMMDKNGGSDIVFNTARKIRQTKGIIVNSFLELESYAIKALSDNDKTIPKIYPIGPIIKHNCTPDDAIMSWLDNQPSASVVFLCFGSLGSFNSNQVKEIGRALERCGCQFLWSLRRPPPKGEIDAPDAYANPEEVLPEGFLDRTRGIGKVIGWVPQIAILSHPAVGGFVSHCGWNSILESLWFGVPIAAWPMYAEQQINAFEMVAEMGIAAEIKMDYRHDANLESKIIVSAEEIENGVRKILIDNSKNEFRKKLEDLKEKSRKAIVVDGSSYNFLGHLIDNVMDNIPKVCSTSCFANSGDSI